MAITPSIVLPSPAILTSGEPAQLLIRVENSEASAITITGVDVLDRNLVFTLGDAIPGVPVRYDTYASGSTTGSQGTIVGTPITASVPAWGTANQSNILYYPGNVSGSTWSITSASGSYGGGSASSTSNPNWVVVPAGATGSYQVGVVSNLLSDVSGSALTNFLVGSIVARVSVSGSASTIDTAASSLYLVSKVIKNAELAPIGVGNLIPANTFARSPIYANFDAPLQTNLVFNDDTTLDITAWDIRNNYTSSAPATISVVQSGSYISTTPSTNLTNSVGSIYGGQNTQLSGGAGAMTFAGLSATSVGVISSATLSNRLGATLTGSCVIGLTAKVPASSYIADPQGLINRAGASSPATLKNYVVWNDGTSEECSVANGWTNTWTSDVGTSTPLSLNTSTGVASWVGTYNGQPVVSCTSVKGVWSVKSSRVIICTYSL